MRRPAPEWLLLPVFVLPIALAATVLAVARAEYGRALDACGADGATSAAAWLDADPARAAWAASRFDDALARSVRDGDGWAAFRRGGVTGVVRRPGARADEAPWVLAKDYPGGLRPDALADPAVRLAVESGTPIAASPGADAATAAYADLVAHPSPAALRVAPLPAATKLHLLLRDADADPADAAALRALRDVETALDDTGDRPGPGTRRAGRTTVLVPSDGGRVVVLPDGDALPAIPPLAVCDDPSGIARLVWSPERAGDGAGGGAPLWRGRLESPLAGDWSIVLADDAAWWRTGAGRWAVPLAAGCLAFLAVPTALLVALRRRRRLDAARARFVNEIAHDLRTPVAALRLHADLLASGRVAEADRPRHAEIVGREAARLTALLANLLDLSRLERGTRPFERAEVDLADVVRDAVREFQALHPRRGADVTAQCPDRLVVDCDRAALSRVLANLLDNAGKFTDAGTAIRVRVEAAAGAPPCAASNGRAASGARIVVEDEGPGIAADERARVFRPYERGAAAGRTAAPGSGLGLALVRELVEGMGGSVALLDSPRGAAFEVALPGGGGG